MRAFWVVLLLCCPVTARAGPLPPPGGAWHVTQADVTVAASGGSFDEPPARWHPAETGRSSVEPLPYRWPRAVIPAADAGLGQRRLTELKIDLSGMPASAGGIWLYLPRWQTIGRIAVYGDERLLYRSRADIVWNGFNHPLWLQLDSAGAHLPKTLRLRIDSLASAGGAVSSLWIGPPQALETRWRWRRWLQSGVVELMGAAVLGLGAFAAAVWLLRRRDRQYLLFAVYSVLVVLRGLHFHLGLEPLPIPSAWFGWMTVNAVNALLVTWYFFVSTLVPNLPRLPGRCLLVLTALAAIATLPITATADALAPLSYAVTIIAAVPPVLMMAWAAWRHGSRDGILASAVGLIDLPVAMHDWAMQNYIVGPESVYLWPISTTARLLMFIYVILRRYVAAIDDAERANLHLAQRLQEREAELAASYERLRAVQERDTLSRERRRLMHDIHDGMGSQLTSALKVAEAGHLSEAQMALVLRECIDDLKLTVDSLEPVEADLLLLLATLRYRLTPRLEGSGLRLRWEVRDVPALGWLDPRSALHVLRILQEGISNIIQHAGATELRVATAVEGEGVAVLLIDDGRGFASRAPGEVGKGLSSMTRRALAIGGHASWAAVDGGTRFRLWLPLHQGIAEPMA